MLMRTDNCAVHIVDIPIQFAGGIGLSLHSRKEAVPDARCTPTLKPAVHCRPRTVALRQVTPRRTRPGEGADMFELWFAIVSVISGLPFFAFS